MVRNKMRKLLVLLLVQILLTVSDYNNSSIFIAEAKAIDIALYHIRDQSEKQSIYSDSLSVLKSFIKDLHHRNPLIQQILKKYDLSVSKDIIFCWLPSHINICGNELADLEAKSALSLTPNFKTPYSVFKSNIRQYIPVPTGEEIVLFF